jgi:hypothetical protein
MYLRQFRFPDVFDSRDKLVSADSDRCFQWDYEHATRCFEQHVGSEIGFETWLMSVSNAKVLDFIRDILRADANVVWTGYRILGSVHQGNGFTVYTFQLFAKHNNTKTKVYTGHNAPNVAGFGKEISIKLPNGMHFVHRR